MATNTLYRKNLILEIYRSELLILAIVLCVSSPSLAQKAPEIEWQKCFGGMDQESGQICAGRSIIQTNDGGYAFCGATSSNDGDVAGNHGGQDAWVVKLNSSGVIQWQKCLGGSKGEWVTCIIQTSDNGYAIAGHTYSIDADVAGNDGGSDAWIVKLDSSGIIQWQRCFGASSTNPFTDTYAFSIIQTPIGEYIVGGYRAFNQEGCHLKDDAYMLNLSSTGGILWWKCFGGSNTDGAYTTVQTADGGYAFTGLTESNDYDVSGYHGDSTNMNTGDAWLVSINSFGSIKWQKCLGGFANDAASSIIRTADSGFILAGSTNSNDGDVSGNHGDGDAWVIKVNSLGKIEWQKCLGGTLNDAGNSIIETSDGGYAIAGQTNSNDGDVSGHHGDTTNSSSDAWVVKLSATGDIQWQKCLGGSGADIGYSIIETSDGGYAILGRTQSNDGDVSGNHGGSDLWVVKLKGTADEVENGNPGFILSNSVPYQIFKIYPNPSSDQVHLQLYETQAVKQVNFYDLMGREISPQYDFIDNVATVYVHSLPPGAYVARVTVSYQNYTGMYTLPLIVKH